jgi:hypothetical protein
MPGFLFLYLRDRLGSSSTAMVRVLWLLSLISESVAAFAVLVARTVGNAN